MAHSPITPAEAKGKFVRQNDPSHTEFELLTNQINESLAETQVSQGGTTPRVALPVRQHSESVRASIITAYTHASVGWNVELITDVNGVDYLEFWAD